MKAATQFVLLVLSISLAHAELPAPDNIVYGTIALGGVPVLPSNTNVVVEARRTATGPAVASYRMGDNPDAAQFYALKIPLEEQAPLDSATSSLVAQSLFIVVRQDTTDRGQATYLIPERGHVTRLDFDINTVVTPPDTDGDGLPDPWEMNTFGNLSQIGSGDSDKDGTSNLDEYLAGTSPLSAVAPFALIPNRTGANHFVSFFSISTAGVTGYEGATRHYGIEMRGDLTAGAWTPLTGYTNIPGNNSIVDVPVPSPAPNAFYRGKVWLTRP
jgi:hypothetical protein